MLAKPLIANGTSMKKSKELCSQYQHLPFIFFQMSSWSEVSQHGFRLGISNKAGMD